MTWRILIVFILVACYFGGPVKAQTGSGADALFEEAQRYHLGLDQPVNYAQAFALYKKVVEADPNHKDAYYNMAHICISQKRYDLAISYYTQVVRLDPQDSDAFNNLGTVYLRQGETQKAKRAYAKAVQLDRNLALAYYNLAIIFVKEGDKERAAKAIEQALKLEPDNPDFVKLRSEILGEKGKISDWWALAAFGGFGGFIVGYYWLFGRKGV